MKTRFIIFRHGQTDWNKETRSVGKKDIPLNDLGRQQAEKLALRLAGKQITMFYSSPLSRAKETAEIVARKHGKPVIIMEDLIEMDMGDWEGKTKIERDTLFPWFDLSKDEHRKKIGMETFARWVPRFKNDVIPELLSKHGGETIVLSTHLGKMRALLFALGLPESVKSEKVGNTALTIVDGENGSIDIVCHGDVSHLNL